MVFKAVSAEDARKKANEVIDRMGLDADASPFIFLADSVRWMLHLWLPASRYSCADEPTGFSYKECMQVIEYGPNHCAKGCAYGLS